MIILSLAQLALPCEQTAHTLSALRLEPAHQRLVVDRWPRPGDQSFMLERPLAMSAEHPIRLRVLVDGTYLIAYANDQVALSCRLYEHRCGAWGLFVAEGEVSFSGLTLKVR